MTNVGRRPDGPGLYRYSGPDPFYGFRLGAYQHDRTVCEVYDNGAVSFFGRNGSHVDAYPGDFVPLTKPVAAPTWSQEPPNEEGWYWFVGKLVQPYEYNPQIYTIRTITPMYLFWTTVPEECLIIDHADFIWRAEHAQGHWLPATVPQPPTGEVGP